MRVQHDKGSNCGMVTDDEGNAVGVLVYGYDRVTLEGTDGEAIAVWHIGPYDDYYMAGTAMAARAHAWCEEWKAGASLPVHRPAYGGTSTVILDETVAPAAGGTEGLHP